MALERRPVGVGGVAAGTGRCHRARRWRRRRLRGRLQSGERRQWIDRPAHAARSRSGARVCRRASGGSGARCAGDCHRRPPGGGTKSREPEATRAKALPAPAARRPRSSARGPLPRRARGLQSARLPPRARVAPARPPAGAACRHLPRARTGGLFVDSRPVGANVFVDNKLIGTTPLAFDALNVGDHAVRLERDGYRPWIASVSIVGGERNRVASLDR